jgi:hypothetical protein
VNEESSTARSIERLRHATRKSIETWIFNPAVRELVELPEMRWRTADALRPLWPEVATDAGYVWLRTMGSVLMTPRVAEPRVFPLDIETGTVVESPWIGRRYRIRSVVNGVQQFARLGDALVVELQTRGVNVDTECGTHRVAILDCLVLELPWSDPDGLLEIVSHALPITFMDNYRELRFEDHLTDEETTAASRIRRRLRNASTDLTEKPTRQRGPTSRKLACELALRSCAERYGAPLSLAQLCNGATMVGSYFVAEFHRALSALSGSSAALEPAPSRATIERRLRDLRLNPGARTSCE